MALNHLALLYHLSGNKRHPEKWVVSIIRILSGKMLVTLQTPFWEDCGRDPCLFMVPKILKLSPEHLAYFVSGHWEPYKWPAFPFQVGCKGAWSQIDGPTICWWFRFLRDEFFLALFLVLYPHFSLSSFSPLQKKKKNFFLRDWKKIFAGPICICCRKFGK